MNYQVKIIRSGRKTIAIRVNEDLSVTVRTPYRVPAGEIERVLREKESWINKHIKIIRDRQAMADEATKSGMVPSVKPASKMSPEEVRELADRALTYIPERVRYFAPIVGVDYGRITIRNQKTRWGSCSSKGNLNFNCFLMLTPPEVIDYVVVHELCHRKEMNHSKAYWNEVARVLPGYKKQVEWMKKYGAGIL